MLIAERWFERKTINDAITLLWEPHVDPLMRCNIWHVRGRDYDLVVDTGMGVGKLLDEMSDLLDKRVTAVATHSHVDHVGGHHEFDSCVAHRLEADLLTPPNEEDASLYITDYGDYFIHALEAAGYEVDRDAPLISALPYAGYQLTDYRIHPAQVTRIVEDGDVIDIGDRHFEVLHLPGHSPGSIGLWEAQTGTLFSGDCIYDGPLLDELGDSNIDDYIASMKRLRQLPVQIVHAGHEPSFGRERLHELVDAYLSKRDH